jgi:hypothetical protein
MGPNGAARFFDTGWRLNGWIKRFRKG